MYSTLPQNEKIEKACTNFQIIMRLKGDSGAGMCGIAHLPFRNSSQIAHPTRKATVVQA